MKTVHAKMSETQYNLSIYGNHRIKRLLRTKGYHWSEELYHVSLSVAELNEALFYLLESDQGWSKEYTQTHRDYKLACKVAYKMMKGKLK